MSRLAGSVLWWLALRVALAILLGTGSARAGERLSFRLGPQEGMDADAAHEVVVVDGELWIGTPLGVRRYDGWRVEPVVPDAPPHTISQLAPRDQGGVYAADELGVLFVVERGRRQRVQDVPASGPIWDIATEPLGRLWVLQAGEAHRRSPAGVWEQPLDGVLDRGERPIRLQAHEDGMVVTTDRGAFVVAPDGPRRLVRQSEGDVIQDAVELGDGTVLTLDRGGLLSSWAGGQRTMLADHGRGIDLQVRGEEVWAAWDHAFGVVHAGRAETQRVPSGGPFALGPDDVLVQGREDGVWFWPEPSTVRERERPEVPSTSIRYLDLGSDGRVGVSTWGTGGVWQDGRMQILPDWRVPGGRERPQPIREPLCPAPDGRVWFSANAGHDYGVIGSWRPGSAPEFVRATHGGSTCSLDAEGGVWLAGDQSLFRASAEGLVRIAATPVDAGFVQVEGEHVWVGRGGSLCKALRRSLGRGEPWTCLDIGRLGARGTAGVVEEEHGTVLIATTGGGLLRHMAGQLRRHPASDAVLGSRDLKDIKRSPRGGLWIAGRGGIARVRSSDLQVLERLGAPQGLDRSAASAVVELPGGDMLLGTPVGLVEVPARARTLPPVSPVPRLVSVAVNGEEVSGDAAIPVPTGPSRIAIRVAAMSLREPGRVRYRVQVDGAEELVRSDGSIQVFDLSPGAHRVDVQAGLPGRPWSDRLSLRFDVATPWWQTTSFRLLVIGLLALLALGAYRARVAWLLGRERQRTHLAMDLHDELGSGLGSIRLLASVLEKDGVDIERRQDVARRIRTVAGELHESVQELVGSLRPGGATADALLDRIGERARNLFPDVDAEVRVVLPDELTGATISLPVRRELERIAAEALHNAARHGRARRVVVGLRPAGSQWELWIDDDGSGFEVGAVPRGSGLGLQSMRERAHRIGATVAVRSTPGQGTTVSVRFARDAQDERRSRR